MTGFQGQSQGGEEVADRKKTSYAIGILLGTGLRKEHLDGYADLEEVQRGLADTFPGATPGMTEAEARTVLDRLQFEMRQKRSAEEKALREKAKNEGRIFLEKNAKLPDVQVLPSGLQYRVLASGKGPVAGSNDVICARCVGRLPDGTEFTDKAPPGAYNELFRRSQNDLIPGLREALGLMRVGDHWEIAVPPQLGYASPPYSGSPIIPGGALIYDLEIFSIKSSYEEVINAGKADSKPN